MSTRQQRRAQERETAKLSERFDRHGCARCGSRPYHGALPVLSNGSVVCPGCVKDGDAIVALLALFEKAPPSEDDREWFKANPGAEHRIRPAYHGEIDEIVARTSCMNTMAGGEAITFEPAAKHVLVLQVEEGIRTRHPIDITGLSAAEIEEKLTVALPWVREASARSLAMAKTMDPGDMAVAQYAGTTLALDNALGRGRLTASFIEKGHAMREARNSIKH